MCIFHSVGKVQESRHTLKRAVIGFDKEVAQAFKIFELMLSYPMALSGLMFARASKVSWKLIVIEFSCFDGANNSSIGSNM